MIKRAYLLLLLCALIGSACNPTKRLGDGEIFLRKNVIKTDQPEQREDLEIILKQKENRKILGILRFHLGVYNIWSGGKKDTKFKKWMRTTIGEPPVVIDTILVRKSSRQIGLYMKNQGYFKAQTSDTIVMKGKKKAKVVYSVKSGEPYTINQINFFCEDPYINSIVDADFKRSLLKKGGRYDTNMLQKERERITDDLKKQGYFNFNENFIRFNVDSSLRSMKVDLYMIIDKKQDDLIDTLFKNHKSYFINNIYVRTNHDPLNKRLILVEDTVSFEDFKFIYSPTRNRFKPALLSQHIFIRKGDFYNKLHVENSYRRLADLGVFKFININYKPTSTTDNDRLLNAFINLTPRAKQDYAIELEGTHNGGNLGAALNFVYRNKNTFGGAELLEIKIKGAGEYQREFIDSTFADEPNISLFNTYEFGPEVNLTFQKFLIPWNLRKISKKANPITKLQTSYNTQLRPEYARRIAKMSFGYGWRESLYKRHEVVPFEFNYVDVNLTSVFEEKVLATNDQSLINSYKDQLIADGGYTYTFSNQKLNTLKDFWYFRFNFEIAGNSLYIIDRISKSKKDSIVDRYTRFNNVPYAQYLKQDADLRFYHILSPSSSIIYRAAGGIGITYGNSSNVLLPFEKSYFGGGSNDMRAWRAKTLGPGSYKDPINLEQFGEIKLSANIEYRFKIISLLNGALFLDAGNIWLREKDEDRKNAEFKIGNIYNDLAVGAGLGLRLDFQFFILRIDPAVKVKDPVDPSNKWFNEKYTLREVEFNIGIGYPF